MFREIMIMVFVKYKIRKDERGSTLAKIFQLVLCEQEARCVLRVDGRSLS